MRITSCKLSEPRYYIITNIKLNQVRARDGSSSLSVAMRSLAFDGEEDAEGRWRGRLLNQSIDAVLTQISKGKVGLHFVFSQRPLGNSAKKKIMRSLKEIKGI